MDKIYFDYAASTPVDERVLEAMMPYFSQKYGNPSSVHGIGQQAEAAVDSAREMVAGVLGCLPDEIIFTSGGTESDNLALRGAAMFQRKNEGRNRIVTSRVEHHAVSKTAAQLEDYYGFDVDWLDVDENGMVTVESVAKIVNAGCAVVSVMYANNEIGTINPIHEIAKICHSAGVVFHSDAVQAAAYLPIDVNELGVDLLSLGGHKFYGPKGIGALYVRKGTKILSSQTGGGQENGLRAGTQNVAYIVGFAKALQLNVSERDRRTIHVRPLRDQIIGSILENVPETRLTGSLDQRLPNHASFAFKGVDGNLLLTLLDSAGFACSSGSACKTGNPEPSEVMVALGLSREWGLGSLRITLGMGSTSANVQSLLTALPVLVQKARSFGQA